MKQLALSLILALSYAPFIQAEEAPKAETIPLNFSFILADYGQTKSKADGVDDSTSSSARTLPLANAYIGSYLGNATFYLYPFSEANRFVSLGYMVHESIELGVDLGLNRNSNSGDENTTSDLAGIWAGYYTKVKDTAIEFQAIHDVSTSKIETHDSNGDRMDAVSRNTYDRFTLTAVHPLSENLSGTFQIYHANSKTVMGDGSASVDKTSGIQLGVRVNMK